MLTIYMVCLLVLPLGNAEENSTEANKPVSHSTTIGMERIIRAARYTTSRSSTRPKAKLRSRDQFQVKTQLEQDNDQALCNSKSNANITRKGQTYAGSKGLTYSEDAGNGKSLICKSKSFRITNHGGTLRKVAAGGSAVLSDSADVDKLLNGQQTNSRVLEVGSIGKSAIGLNAAKKEVAAAIESQGGKAGSSSMSKSRLVPHGLETMSNVDGGTDMKGRKVLGMRGISREATQILKNPKGSGRGNRQGDTLTHMGHRRKANFEIEI